MTRHVKRAEVETLAVFVHGALASLHLLGFVFNLRRAKTLLDLDVAIHAAAFVYDIGSARKHAGRT